MNILDILNQVAATNSPIEKAQILNEHKNNETLKTVCRLANNPLICWNTTHTVATRKFPDHPWLLAHVLGLMEEMLPTRVHTGNKAKAFMEDCLSHLIPDDEEVVRRVILKDLRSGFGESITNKIWPGLIPTFDFMLCDTRPECITYPAYSQLKADGMRCACSIDERTGYTLMSRNGKFLDDKGVFKNDIIRISDRNKNAPCVIDGELVCYKDGEPLDRKTSNGILNKAVRGTISEDEAKLIRFIAWDVADYTNTIPYVARWDHITDLVDDLEMFAAINTIMCEDEEDALNHFKELRRKGYEGTIVKNCQSVWVPKRSKDQCKFKAEIEAEFRVTGFEYGTGKNATKVGNLLIESEDGLVKSAVGIFKDFDESVRTEWLTNLPKIVTILYNERIKDKSRKDGTESLFLPRVTAVRPDKDVANTRDEMIAIEKAVLE